MHHIKYFIYTKLKQMLQLLKSLLVFVKNPEVNIYKYDTYLLKFLLDIKIYI